MIFQSIWINDNLSNTDQGDSPFTPYTRHSKGYLYVLQIIVHSISI